MRRLLLAAGAGALVAPALAGAQHAGHGPTLRQAPPSAQRVFASPAPAGPQGRWVARADTPIPRSGMAWATAPAGRMQVVGGYGEVRANRAYHSSYDPGADAWRDAGDAAQTCSSPAGVSAWRSFGGRAPVSAAADATPPPPPPAAHAAVTSPTRSRA